VRLVFFGSGAFGLPTLERLAQAHELALVVSQPDRPAGRGRGSAPTPVAVWARERALPLRTPERVNDPQERDAIRQVGADAWVVIAFGQKLSPELLADRFAINLHASLLPRWRGAAPINAAILAGDEETGDTVITLADRMDAGLILAQSRRRLDPAWTAGDLHDILAADGPELVLRVLNDCADDRLSAREQDESLVTIAGKHSRRDAWVDFTDSAEACRRRIHAFSPRPGVTAAIAGEQVRLLRARVEPGAEAEAPVHQQGSAAPPGALLDPASGLVACAGAGSLRLLEVQPAGKRPMAWAAYALGRRLDPGAMVEGRVSC